MATDPGQAGTSSFPRTRWTLVIQAAGPDADMARWALEEICAIYWQPIYAFLRRSGHKPEDAEDLTQSFFAELLGGQFLLNASDERGKLRSFLLGALKRFLSSWAKHERAQKRGGRAKTLSLDQEEAEVLYVTQLIEEDSPDVLYERAWAKQLADRADEALRAEYQRMGKARTYQQLSTFLAWDKGNAAYREAAVELGISETNLRTSVYRMRRRYRELLVAEITDTVESAEQADQELQHLLDVLGGR